MKINMRTREHEPVIETRLEPELPEQAVPDFEDFEFGNQLVLDGSISATQLESALATATEKRQSLACTLTEGGLLDEEQIARALAVRHGVELADLRSSTPDTTAMALLPESVARAHLALPLGDGEDAVIVAVADPRASVLDALRTELGKEVQCFVAPREAVLRAIDHNYRALTSVDMHLAAFAAQDAIRREAARSEIVEASGEAPVVKVVQAIITQGLRDRASDIHIEPAEDQVRIRYRIDGALHEVLSLPVSIGPSIVSRIKILGGMNIVERRRPQDGQISMDLDERSVDIRVSTTAVVNGEKVVLRLLDKSRPLFRVDDLGMPQQLAQQFRSLLHSPHGMVVCAGPTGSGKTTTLYSSLGEINSPERNIMTIEDPVEYRFPTINQIQINEQAGITFAGGLRSILRQDPDVILVGEVRDVDTARIAIQSALTGHFVLSSLHATDAVSAMHRLMDMGIEGFLIASSVTAVLSQRLVRRVCVYCQESYPTTKENQVYLRQLGLSAPAQLVRGVGCNFCSGTGYLDRIGVYELMVIDDNIRQLILERASHEEMRKMARANGMRTLQEEAGRLVCEGITDIPDIVRSIEL